MVRMIIREQTVENADLAKLREEVRVCVVSICAHCVCVCVRCVYLCDMFFHMLALCVFVYSLAVCVV